MLITSDKRLAHCNAALCAGTMKRATDRVLELGEAVAVRLNAMLRRIEIVASIFAIASLTARAGLAAEDSEARGDRPNFLLIISDDIGTDVTSSMQPGLIDELIEQYGPSGQRPS